MGYEKLNLSNGDKFNAEHVAHIENGIEAAVAQANENASNVNRLSEEIDKLKAENEDKPTSEIIKPEWLWQNINSEGELSSGTHLRVSCEISPVPDGGILIEKSSETYKATVYQFAADGTLTKHVMKESETSFTVDGGYKIVRLCTQNVDGSIEVTIEEIDAAFTLIANSNAAGDGATIDERVTELEEAVFATVTGKNMVNPNTTAHGFLLENGETDTSGSVYANYETSDYIEVGQNKDYTFTLYDPLYSVIYTSRKIILMYDGEKNAIQGSYQNVADLEKVTFNTGDASYVRVCADTKRYTESYAGLMLQLEAGTEFTGFAEYKQQARKIRNNYPEQTYGKKWVVFGDSFTAGGYNTSDGFDASVYKYQNGKYAGKNITYPYIIAERSDMEIVQYFAGGRTLANPADGSFTNSITNPSGSCYYQTIPADADYITIYLGINDSHHESGTSGGDGEDVTGVIQLGTIDDQDTSTFCGAWNVVLPWLMTNRPNAHIGIIVSNGVDRVEYRTATIAAAKKWGIPYLDLNGDERCPAMIRTVNPDISAEAKEILRQKWRVTETNGHPNTAAQRFQSAFIENWLRTL